MDIKLKKEYDTLPKEVQIQRLKEIATVFLKLGATAFGGPAAHVAMMEDEIVKKRKWLNKEDFLDLYGATNLIPGPNSTELAIHLGYERGGILGLILAGSCFIFPAMLIVMLIAVAYSAYGTLPEVDGIMYGIKPAVFAVILQALIRLGQSAIKNMATGILGFLVIVLSFFGFHELLLLAMTGLIMMVVSNHHKLIRKGARLSLFIPPLLIQAKAPTLLLSADASSDKAMGLTGIFLNFLKIGSVLYGSGYVLLAFLESDFVERYGVLTKQQLLDAISVGQFTPGPVFTTATFIGYLINGFWGGVLATIGIFLPAFVLVALFNPFIHRLRRSSWISGVLDGLNVASWGLMAVVIWKLAAAAIIDIPTVIITLIALVIVFRYKINSAWLVLGGGLLGYLVTWFNNIVTL